MAETPEHDEDFHPAKRGDNPIWLGGMKYVREDVAKAEKQLAVTAALREAAALIGVKVGHGEPLSRCGCGACVTRREDHEAILARIPDAGKALDRALAEQYLSGWVNGSNGVAPPDFGDPVFVEDDAIRAQKENPDG